MPKYAYFVGEDSDWKSSTADETPETEPKYRETGLVDQYGTPICRVRETLPIGFHYPSKS